MLGSDIRELVRIKLEEYSPYNPSTDGPLLSGGDVLEEIKPIMAYVDAHMSEAANEMLLIVPVSFLNPIPCLYEANPDEYDNFIGSIEAPEDYLKIHTFKMSCWKKAVHVTYKQGGYMDSRQVYVSTRGNLYKPVLIEDTVTSPFSIYESRKVLRYYSTSGNHDIDTYTYVGVFDDAAEYRSEIAELIALNCAKKVCKVFERADSVTIIDNEIQSVMQKIMS